MTFGGQGIENLGGAATPPYHIRFITVGQSCRSAQIKSSQHAQPITQIPTARMTFNERIGGSRGGAATPPYQI
ncbi:MAG: hypothetical protein ACREFR_14445, partial [Limisphaerales bacterium]